MISKACLKRRDLSRNMYKMIITMLMTWRVVSHYVCFWKIECEELGKGCVNYLEFGHSFGMEGSRIFELTT
jgi:hypothetical protein